MDGVRLSLEQQFALRSFEGKTEQMTYEETKGTLIKLYEQMMLRENQYKAAIKKDWGI